MREPGRRRGNGRSRTSRDTEHGPIDGFDGPETAKSPLPAETPQAGGLRVSGYFFLPWVSTARSLALVNGGCTATDLWSDGCWWSLSVVAC